MTVAHRLAALLDPPTIDAATIWADYDVVAQPKQALAEDLSSQVDELLFGGSVGGGKSWWLLLHVIAEMEAHPGNRGLVLRRTMPRLARTLLPRAETLLAGRTKPNRNDHTFTWPNGSILEFGHLEHATSVHNYQGAEYGVIGFEEVTEFVESQWEFLTTRLRAPAPGIRAHMVATTNPGGPGHRWVKRRWVRPQPEDVVGPVVPKSGDVWSAVPKVEDQTPVRRVFVPSLLEDNPALMARDPGYRARMLAGISNRALREAVGFGDWDAIDRIEGTLWDWDWIEPHRRAPGSEHLAGGLVRVVVAVDPAASAKTDSDETGIVVAGKGADGRGYVLADRSCQLSPDGWGRRAVQAYRDHQADRIVAERNNGGDMVTAVLKAVDAQVPVQTVWASRGKVTRAEPIAALYEAGKVSHLGTFPNLEEQLTTWSPDDGDSPDRLDALVWALTELMLGDTGPVTSAPYRDSLTE